MGMLVWVISASGCRTINNTIGLPPFIEYNTADKEWAVRPIFTAKAGDVKCVWPLFRYKHDEKGVSSWLLPFMVYRARPQEKGMDRDFYLFPFIAWGSSPEEGDYFAFFPFGGRLKSFMGKDEFDFALWPLYMRLRDRDTISRHILFPLINWVSGGGRSGWRFWPFWAAYSAVTREGLPKYLRRFVLWPFFSRQWNQLDTKNPSDAWIFFPFYSHAESNHLSHTNILWPLYAHREDRKRKLNTWGMSVVPIRFSQGESESQWDFWPFWGWWDRPERFRQFCLWPLQRYEYEDTDKVTAERFWLLPFWWQTDVAWHEEDGGDTTRSRRKLWPFFSYEAKGEAAHWEALSILPWFDPVTDHFWGRLFQLARYQRQGRKKAFELLWGLYSQESDETQSVWRILGGCFSRRVAADKTIFRFLFIPFTVEH